MSWRLTDRRAGKNASSHAINLVNPLSEPVAIVDGIEGEVGPHIMRVVPHSPGLPPIDLALDIEGCCVHDRDCPGLENATYVPLIGDPFELRVDPHLAHAGDRGSYLGRCVKDLHFLALISISRRDRRDH